MTNEFKNNHEFLNFVEEKFNNCFEKNGYIKEEPVKITSKIDPTVDLVGSKITPLKKYIENNNIPNEGVSLVQNCMKTRVLKFLKDDSIQTFGSCYKGMGTITKYNLDKIVSDTFEYFLDKDYLGIDYNDIRIRLNSSDKDIIESVKRIDKNILCEYNTESIENYLHVYGMDEKKITGRNLNIALRKKGTDNFFDCAAIIVMESPYEKIAIDMGIGNTTLGMCYFNTDNTVKSSRIGDLININNSDMMKLADSIVASSTLLYEDILNHPSKHLRKKFRQYLQAVKYWKEKYNISEEDILSIMKRYIELEYSQPNFINDEIKIKEMLKK